MSENHTDQLGESETFVDASAKRTVLIVEDNEINREILAALLEDDYQLITAENGLEGFQMLQERGHQISAVMLDIEMPVWTGYDFLEHKSKSGEYADIPVIVTTANTTIDSEIKALQLGANDFVVKPYNGEAVKNRLANNIRLCEASALLASVERDPVTKLLNADFFCIQADEIVHKEPDAHWFLAAADIANFNVITMDVSAEQSDEVLWQTANALREGLPGFTLGARYGRSGFFLLVKAPAGTTPDFVSFGSAQEANHQAGSLRFGYLEISPHTSVRRQCADALFALDEAYRSSSRTAVFDSQMLARAQRRKLIEDAMEASLAAGEFVPYFQAKHNLATGKICGAEALVRWIHPEMGFMNPGEFIPLMETNGFVTQVDNAVWQQVCEALHTWESKGIPTVPVSVNISRRDFETPDLASKIIQMVDSCEIPHNLLHLEVTESAYTENASEVAHQLHTLQENGFTLELDDFGAGYSSLVMLAETKMDVMKLDMSLVRRADSGNADSLAAMAIRMAQTFGMKTVAEGVETTEKAEEMRALGCDYAQGYLYSKPVPLQVFEQYLQENA